MVNLIDKPLTSDEIKKTKIEDLFSYLSTGKTGLSSQEATSRLQKYGHNEIEEKKINPIKKLTGYFWGPIYKLLENKIKLYQ